MLRQVECQDRPPRNWWLWLALVIALATTAMLMYPRKPMPPPPKPPQCPPSSPGMWPWCGQAVPVKPALPNTPIPSPRPPEIP